MENQTVHPPWWAPLRPPHVQRAHFAVALPPFFVVLVCDAPFRCYQANAENTISHCGVSGARYHC